MKKAEDDAEWDALQSAKHEQWAQQEGEGLGQLGEVKLAIDDDLDDKQTLDLKAGKTTVRI